MLALYAMTSQVMDARRSRPDDALDTTNPQQLERSAT
jgi:hypothetical protein